MAFTPTTTPPHGMAVIAAAENTTPTNGTAHLCVTGAQAAPVSNVKSRIGVPVRKVQRRVVIMTDLPERLPVLPEELALVQGYMEDLVSSILANDNQTE